MIKLLSGVKTSGYFNREGIYGIVAGGIAVSVVLIIYLSLLMRGELVGGIFTFYSAEYLQNLTLPTVWDLHWPDGMGGNQAFQLPLKFYLQVPIVVFTKFMGIPWNIVQKLFWIVPFIVFILISSWKLTRSWIGMLVYSANPWILSRVFSGEFGQAMSYAAVPWVLAQFIGIVHAHHAKSRESPLVILLYRSLRFALLSGFQLIFDPRIAYLTFILCLGYLLYAVVIEEIPLRQLALHALVGSAIALLLNAFWLLPFILTSGGALGEVALNKADELERIAVNSTGSIMDGLIMWYPPWQVISGAPAVLKIMYLLGTVGMAGGVLAYFVMRKKAPSAVPNGAAVSGQSAEHENHQASPRGAHEPITIKYPITAIVFRFNTIVYFLCILAAGVFLAKGIHSPFGSLYQVFYSYVPGFIMFRDPGLFYTAILVSYAVIIPWSLHQMIRLFSDSVVKRSFFNNVTTIVFALFWLGVHYPALVGNAARSIEASTPPPAYVQLSHYLEQDQSFSRTLWIPERPSYGGYSDIHPALDSAALIPVERTADMVAWLRQKDSIAQLDRWSVGHIVLVNNDREYFSALNQISWLHPVKGYSSPHVYRIDRPSDKFWLEGNGGEVMTWRMKNPASYTVELFVNKIPSQLIFSERFDPGWHIRYAGIENNSFYTNDLLNSFFVMQQGNVTASLIYVPQREANIGFVISFLTLFCVILMPILLFSFTHRPKIEI